MQYVSYESASEVTPCTESENELTEISVHPVLGLNARRCFCGGCGKDIDQIRNLGIHNHVIECGACSLAHYGGDDENCKRCGTTLGWGRKRILMDDEKVSGPLCPECQTQSDISELMVKAGGIYCICKQCLYTYAIPADDPLAVRVRNLTEIRPPELVTAHVESCPKCAS